MPSRSAVRSWLALLIAVPLAFLAMWIIVPAPNDTLLPLGVGAPEVSAWFIVLGVMAIAVAAPESRHVWRSRAAFVLALMAVGLATIPFVRFGAVARAAERDMRAAFGSAMFDDVATNRTGAWRRAPLVVGDLFRPPNAPGATAAPVRIARGIVFAVVDSDTLTVDIYRPRNGWSVPRARAGLRRRLAAWRARKHSEFAEYIAAQGYVVFAIDYRHAPQFRFPAQVEDVRTALDWIGRNAETWNADTSRMVLMGRSAGAHLALMAAYAPDAPPVRGVIDYYGPVDLVEGYRQPPVPDPLAVRAVEEAFLGAPPDAMIDRYRAASPISLVTRNLPPTLLIYGGRDHIVEARFGRLLAERLRSSGTTLVHVEIPWAEHAFDAVPYGPSGQLARYFTERFLALTTAP